MRTGISIGVTPNDCGPLRAVVSDRNGARHVWRARTVLLSADGPRRRRDDARLQSKRHHHPVRALDVLEGSVIGRCMQRHRHQ
jgi:hypothetical protein